MIKSMFAKQSYTQETEKLIIDTPVQLIRPNPYQPRKNFNKMALEELCSSIKTYGLLQPITIRRMPGGFYELVAGERRLRAAKIIGMREIPSIIVDIGDNDSAVLALVENSQREDLHFLEEAEAYYNLLNMHNLTQEELANSIGKSPSTISNKIRLLRLTPLIKKVILENGLAERHARAILKLHDEDIQLRILKFVCEKGLNVSKTEEIVDRTIEGLTGIKKEKKKILFGAYKDLRIFVNTIKQAIEMMRKSGIKAQASQEDMGDYVEFKIKVIKK